MHQKRCEQIPAYFIHKYNSKRLRKNLISTKFKWLSKYVADDQNKQQATPMSMIKPKATFNCKKKKKNSLKNKENIKTQTGNQGRYELRKIEQTKLTRAFLSKIYRNSQTKNYRYPRYSVCEDNGNERNKSLLMGRIYFRKTLSSFQAGQTVCFIEKTKIKTNQASNYPKDIQAQNFTPSPWIQTGSRAQNRDSVEYQ